MRHLFIYRARFKIKSSLTNSQTIKIFLILEISYQFLKEILQKAVKELRCDSPVSGTELLTFVK